MASPPGPGTPSTVAPANATIFTGSAGYLVPPGVYSVRIDAWGAQGGSCPTSGGAIGGYGQFISGVFDVLPYDTLIVLVTGDGGAEVLNISDPLGDGEFNGSPGGQSISVYRNVIDPAALLIQAGGGGGCGGTVGIGGSNQATGGNGSPGGAEFPPANIAADGQMNAYIAGGGGAAGTAGGTTQSNSSTAVGSVATNITSVVQAQPGQPGGATVGGDGGMGGYLIFTPSTGGSSATMGASGGSGGGGYVPGAGGAGGAATINPLTGVPGGCGGGGGSGGTGFTAFGAAGVKNVAGLQGNTGTTATAAAVMITPNPPTTQIVLPTEQVIDAHSGFAITLGVGENGTTLTTALIAIRRRTVGETTWEWFTPATGWGFSEYYFASDATYTFAPGTWGNGRTWELQVSAIDDTTNEGAVGPYSGSWVFTAQSPPSPSLVVTGTASSSPTIGWLPGLAPGAIQVSYELEITDTSSGTVLYDSGVVYSAATRPAADSIPFLRPGTYSILLIVAQSGGLIGFTAETVVLTPATIAAPLVTMAPSGNLQAIPSVTVTVAGAPGQTVGILQRSYDRLTWTSVRGAAGLAVPATVVDTEVIPGLPVRYRAQVGTTTDGLVSRSPYEEVGPVVVLAKHWWISDPTTPGSGIALYFCRVDMVGTWTEREATYSIMDDPDNVVLFDVVGSPSYAVTLTFLDEPSWDAFVALQAKTTTLLLTSPMMGKQWYVHLGPTVTENVKVTAFRAGVPWREVKATAQVVAMPWTESGPSVIVETAPGATWDHDLWDVGVWA